MGTNLLLMGLKEKNMQIDAEHIMQKVSHILAEVICLHVSCSIQKQRSCTPDKAIRYLARDRNFYLTLVV